MRPDLSKMLLVALALAGLVAGAGAAAPVNDRCSGAIAIPGGGPFPQFTQFVDITDATTTGDPPLASCRIESVNSRSVWYLFRPSATDVYRITTCGESDTGTTVRDTVMAIYTASSGCGSTYTERACSDDTCNFQSEITTSLSANVNYYIVVWQSGTSAPLPEQGGLRLRVDRGRPANDDCSNPQPVQLNVPVLGRTLYARNDYELGNSLCFTGVGQTAVDTPGLEVVFSFMAPSDGDYSFKVKNYAFTEEGKYDLVVYVSPVCPPADGGGTTVNDCLGAANRNLNIAEEVSCLALTNSQQVYIFVDDLHPDNRGSTFTLEVTRCIREAEPNDSLIAAQPYSFEITGNAEPVNDADYYALGTFAPGSRVFALVDTVSASLIDFDLWVLNSMEVLEYDDNNNDEFYGQSAGSVAGTPLTSGCAWLCVLPRQQVTSEPYRLYAVVQPPASSATTEIEPNGTIAQAQSSPLNYFRGYLPDQSDEDIYAFTAVEGDIIFLGLDADPLRNRTPFDAQLELLNTNGSILMLVDDFQGNTSNTNVLLAPPYSPAETIVCRAPYSGQYYARVLISPFAEGSLEGDYLLSISRNGFLGTGATNIPPALADLSAPPVPQSSNAVLTASISDPDAGGQFSVTINWGDNTPHTTLALEVCQYSFEATHQYAQPGTYPVTVWVHDMHGGVATANTSIDVTSVTAAPATIGSIRYQSDGSVLLDLEGSAGATYRIEVSEDLQNWTTLTIRTADAAGQFQLQDSPPLPQRRFYRAVWP